MADTSTEPAHIAAQDRTREELLRLFPTCLIAVSGGLPGVTGRWEYFDGVRWTPCIYNDPLQDCNAARVMVIDLLKRTPPGGGYYDTLYSQNLKQVCARNGRPWQRAETAAAWQVCEALVMTLKFSGTVVEDVTYRSMFGSEDTCAGDSLDKW